LVRWALAELWYTLVDAWEMADVPGHLSAWWYVVRNKEVLG